MISLAVVVLLAFSTKVYSQDKMLYGFDMGFTISFFDQRSAPYEDPQLVSEFSKAVRASFEFGMKAEYPLNNTFSLGSGLRYSEKGGAYKTKNPDFAYINQFSGNRVDDAYNYLRYRLTYLEVPLSIKIDLYNLLGMPKEDSKLNLIAGVSGMLNIGSKFRYNTFTGNSDADEEWDSSKLTGAKGTLLSWQTGLEWNEGPLILYAKYYKNIGEVYDTSKEGFENFGVNMSTIGIGMGFWLN